MKITITQAHIDAGIRLNTADPFALAIKETLNKLPTPDGCIRVERVVGVSSSILVIQHRIIKRKSREETDLYFEKYFFGPKAEFNIHDPAFDWNAAFGFGQPVQPITIEITRDETYPQKEGP